MDPSGTYVKYEAKAIGSGSEGAMQSLQVSLAKHLSLPACEVHVLAKLAKESWTSVLTFHPGYNSLNSVYGILIETN